MSFIKNSIFRTFRDPWPHYSHPKPTLVPLSHPHPLFSLPQATRSPLSSDPPDVGISSRTYILPLLVLSTIVTMGYNVWFGHWLATIENRCYTIKFNGCLEKNIDYSTV